MRGRAQRFGQVQRRRRPGLGDGRAGGQEPARRQDGGRHLRRDVRPRAPGSRRGVADHRQLRRRAADRLLRGHDLARDVPLRRLGVLHQRHRLPPARHPGAAERLRHRPRDARDRRPGPARPDPARHPGGAPRVHRGGRGRPQAPQAQGACGPQARRDAGQPHPRAGPHHRAAPPADPAGQAGGGRAPGECHPDRRARRRPAPARRRPAHTDLAVRAGGRRRVRGP